MWKGRLLSSGFHSEKLIISDFGVYPLYMWLVYSRGSAVGIAVSLGIKRPGRGADHSTPTSADGKKTWIYTSTPPVVFVAQCLVKHRHNFTFYL
jgi:hypothetical protein